MTPVCKISNPSRIPHEGLAGAKGSSPKKVKAKMFGRETSTSNEIAQNIHFSSLNVVTSGFRVGALLNFFRRTTPHLLTTPCAKLLAIPSRFSPESALLFDQEGFSGTSGPLLVKTNRGIF